jgi:enoyl-CoA hydratase/carnithine racemase
MGLVSAVFAPEDAQGKVREQAERFAAGPALALAAIKRCVHEGGDLPLAQGLALEGELIEQLFRSEDATEGLTAFVEKRPATFTGA